MLAARRLSATGKMQQVKVTRIPSPKNNPCIYVSVEAELESHTRLVIAKVRGKRVVVSLNAALISADIFLPNADGPVVKVVPVAVDKMPFFGLVQLRVTLGTGWG